MSLDAANKVSEDFHNYLKKVNWDAILICYLIGFVLFGCCFFTVRLFEFLVGFV